ncbi:ABC transporter permease [Planctomycetota bacterium]
MRISDYFEQAFNNLWKKKLRTFLTIFAVVIGIGALVCMFAFGKGVQKNIIDSINQVGLFNYISVSERSGRIQTGVDSDSQNSGINPVLDENYLERLKTIEGVEAVFPEIRFPAMIRFRNRERFNLVQVLPVNFIQSGFMKLRAGDFYTSDDENSLILSDTLLIRMGIRQPETVIGEEIEVSTLALDLSFSGILNMFSFLQGNNNALPFANQSYTFTIAGVSEQMGFSGPTPIRSDVFIPQGTSERMKKISITSISDFFQSSNLDQNYSSVSLRLESPIYLDSVTKQIENEGFETFAIADQLEEIKTGFIFLDMFLFAIGMIGIVVASLGIINTMTMSILERYKEIGIIKAVGASDSDVKKIFLFESGLIGLLGGIFGLALGWTVGMIINIVINSIVIRQGVPRMDYFSFPWWLCIGSIAFSIIVSLLAGIYPTMRAARVDPVVALRHD